MILKAVSENFRGGVDKGSLKLPPLNGRQESALLCLKKCPGKERALLQCGKIGVEMNKSCLYETSFTEN